MKKPTDRAEPDKVEHPKLVTVKVTPEIHDELYGYIGELQRMQKRRVTASEAIAELLESCKQALETMQSRSEDLTKQEGGHLSKYGPGRRPKKMHFDDLEGAG